MRGTKPSTVRQDATALARVPAAPSWLSKFAKSEWRRIMPLLVERRILTAADMGSVENYCVAIGRVREIEKQFSLAGGAIDPVFCRMQDKAIQTARQLAAELGLTPVSRSRPTIRPDGNGDADDNPLDV